MNRLVIVLIVMTVSGPPDGQPGPVPAVYAVLFQQRYHAVAATEMSVKDMAVAMPTVKGSSTEWLRQFGVVPADLRRIANRVAPTKAHKLDAAMLPAGAKIIPSKAVDALFTGRTEENRSAFKARFNSRGWVSVSDVLLSADRLNALVYYDVRCGGLCGESGYMWLRRDTSSSACKIAKRIVSSMS
jgi:hypothetical protein